MSQGKRITIAVLIIFVIAGGIMAVEMIRRQTQQTPTAAGSPTLAPGSIPIYHDGALVNGFTPEALQALEEASFVDAEEGKTQQGWLLRDVLALYLDTTLLKPEAQITVSSSSREKSIDLTWAEVAEPQNHVQFDLSGRGTLKLVSVLERFDIRDEWVQDVDKIEVRTP